MHDSRRNLVSLILRKITITSLLLLVFFIILYAYGNFQDFLDSSQIVLLKCVAFLALFFVLVGTIFLITEFSNFLGHKKKRYIIYLIMLLLFDLLILVVGLVSLSIIVLAKGI